MKTTVNFNMTPQMRSIPKSETPSNIKTTPKMKSYSPSLLGPGCSCSKRKQAGENSNFDSERMKNDAMSFTQLTVLILYEKEKCNFVILNSIST